MRLAKVNVIEEKELADEFNIESFPTLKLFMNGDRKQPVDFTGKNTHTHIMELLATLVKAAVQLSGSQPHAPTSSESNLHSHV